MAAIWCLSDAGKCQKDSLSFFSESSLLLRISTPVKVKVSEGLPSRASVLPRSPLGLITLGIIAVGLDLLLRRAPPWGKPFLVIETPPGVRVCVSNVRALV